MWCFLPCWRSLLIVLSLSVSGLTYGESLRPKSGANPLVVRLVHVGPLSERYWARVIYGALTKEGLSSASKNCLSYALEHPVQVDIRNELMVVYDRYLNSVDVQLILWKYEELFKQRDSYEEYAEETSKLLSEFVNGSLVNDMKSSDQDSSDSVIPEDRAMARFARINSLAKISISLMLEAKMTRAIVDVWSCESRQR